MTEFNIDPVFGDYGGVVGNYSARGKKTEMNSTLDYILDSLTSSVIDIDECLSRNEELSERLSKYQHEAEEYSNRCRRSATSLIPFGVHRVGRIPVPENNHSVQHSAFVDRHLGPLNQKADWSEDERSVLSAVLRSDLDSTSVNWTEVARKCFLSGDNFTRGAESCQIEYEHRIKSYPPWSREDDEKLAKLVTEHRGTNWVLIGKLLDRPPAACYSRCYSNLHPVLVPVDFTNEEDCRLSEIIGRIGEGAWSQASAELGSGHTDIQCMNRWNKTLKPGIQGGRWSPVLDSVLMAAVQVYGEGNWVQVARHVPGKTDRKCRERYMDRFKEGLKVATEWTQSEDEKLLGAVEKHGIGKWSKIKSELDGRTDHMCRVRFKKLSNAPAKEQYDALLAERRVAKLARTRKI